MILRRITEHVKAQNWTAVALDFLIVVIGVFIGIQVSNWNAARADRALEARAVMRLEEEVEALIHAREGRKEFAAFIHDGLKEVLIALFDEGGSADFSQKACQAIVMSHVFPSQPDELPVFEELTATGRIDAIRSPSIKHALLNFFRAREHARTTVEAVSRNMYQMSLERPDLVSVRMSLQDDAPDLVASANCDMPVMSEDVYFLNALISNHARQEEYFQKVFIAVDAPLLELHKELELSLGSQEREEERQ